MSKPIGGEWFQMAVWPVQESRSNATLDRHPSMVSNEEEEEDDLIEDGSLWRSIVDKWSTSSMSQFEGWTRVAFVTEPVALF